MQIELSPHELKALLELLKEHQYYGWIEQVGEFEIEASGRVSPVLLALLQRLKQMQRKAA
ncbi:peptidylprolyl isomerase [Meiothermus sp. CFH 77666]|uniref:peptidylprolyl isomerase n=1 Tax=Meiothermus sp. CFH 77666 TaxID=2817942 RepID=UPI001AA022B5|nr:peptidylprolyl isomerase [Meiothermus sp. CFH 77666]MBO1438611.1 peptidylprolyl isomerase [Meiothermus sp. CFH 77666]